MSPFSWQGQNLCGLSFAFIIDWRVVKRFLWLLFQIFKCPSCPQIWGGEGLMKTHKLSHVKPTLAFKCLGCKNIFSSKPAIASHKCPAKSQPKGPTQTPDILQKAVNSINGTKGQPLPTASTTGTQCKVHACSCLKSAWILPYKFCVL